MTTLSSILTKSLSPRGISRGRRCWAFACSADVISSVRDIGGSVGWEVCCARAPRAQKNKNKTDKRQRGCRAGNEFGRPEYILPMGCTSEEALGNIPSPFDTASFLPPPVILARRSQTFHRRHETTV